MNRLAALGTLLGALAVPGVLHGQSDDLTLDLTLAPSSTDAQMLAIPFNDWLMGPSGGFAMSHRPNPLRPPLSVTLSLDREVYSGGQSLQYVIVVENIGATPFAMPVSTLQHLFRRQMSGGRVASMTLVIDDEVLGRQLVSLDRLYGAEAVSGSFVYLQPNQSLTIRGTGHWILYDLPPNLPANWTQTTTVKAEVNLHYEALSEWRTVRSATGLTIVLHSQ